MKTVEDNDIEFKKSILNRGFLEKMKDGSDRNRGLEVLNKAKRIFFENSKEPITPAEFLQIQQFIRSGTSCQTLVLNIIKEGEFNSNENRCRELLLFLKDYYENYSAEVSETVSQG